MGRGILSGLVWGSIVSIFTLGAVSLLAPPPEQSASLAPDSAETATGGVAPLMESPAAEVEPQPAEDPAATPDTGRESTGPATAVDLPAGSEFRKALPDTDAALPADADAPSGARAPDVPAPGREAAARPGASAPRPETPGMSVTAPVAPQAETQAAEPAGLGGTTAARPAPETAAGPTQPPEAGVEAAPESSGFPPPVRTEAVETASRAEALGADGRLGGTAADAIEAGTDAPSAVASTGTELAPSATADIATTVRAAAADAATQPDETASGVAGTSNGSVAVAERLEAESSAPRAAAAPDTVETATGSPEPERLGGAAAEESAEGVEVAAMDRAPEVSVAAPRAPTGGAPEPAVGETTEDGVTGQAEAEAEPEPAPAPAESTMSEAAQGGRFTQVVRPLTERSGTGSRLPQIGAEPDAEVASETLSPGGEAPSSEAAPADDRLTLDALVRNARPFDNPEGKPLFSVILIYDGSTTLDRAVLTTFTFPVTFAIDPMLPDAAEAAEEFAAAGFEVVALATGLPEGATVSDVETTLGAHLAKLPQAVAVMDPETDGLAGRNTLAEQALTMASQDGHGLIGWDRGLGAMEVAARRGDAPVALIYRPLDAEGEQGPAIGRYLDRAAFKAAQDGEVIMVGHARVETVTALFQWALGSKANQVALAPVSAILRAR
ncbi:divergent polysaccharide deacetylase family protein [Tropicimonas sp. IMCC6043]|uniref:divergent polysaccharide deacetylase family protein n=1 Tax=Tropicimonas sp. IMCC6043 TaxID=2510645 RepID=UPI00101C3D59|nr:divergent polysaccharide deacetylase family protein [Tropicimonas sp. IMCC6043]RYH10161.1 hypothetical protein EU800_09765 [Tropicimonas sp. IMCC6043]